MERKVHFTSKEGSSPKGGYSGHSHLQHERFPAPEDPLLQAKPADEPFLVGQKPARKKLQLGELEQAGDVQK